MHNYSRTDDFERSTTKEKKGVGNGKKMHRCIFNLPRICPATVRPSSPRMAFLASYVSVNCTKAYPLCMEIPVHRTGQDSVCQWNSRLEVMNFWYKNEKNRLYLRKNSQKWRSVPTGNDESGKACSVTSAFRNNRDLMYRTSEWSRTCLSLFFFTALFLSLKV